MQQRCLVCYVIGQFLEIGQRRLLIGKSPCQQQGVKLFLRSRNGNDFNDIFAACLQVHGGTAADAVVIADGVAHNEAIQQGRDQLWF